MHSRDSCQYLRILDFANIKDKHFRWIGDIPLIDNNPVKAFSHIIPISYDEKEIFCSNENKICKRNIGLYFMSKYNSHRDSEAQFSIVTCQYTDNLYTHNPDRHLRKNFSVNIADFPSHRYLSAQEIANDWKCLLIRPIEVFRWHQIAKNIIVVKIQYTPSGNMKFKLSIKGLPNLPNLPNETNLPQEI